MTSSVSFLDAWMLSRPLQDRTRFVPSFCIAPGDRATISSASRRAYRDVQRPGLGELVHGGAVRLGGLAGGPTGGAEA